MKNILTLSLFCTTTLLAGDKVTLNEFVHANFNLFNRASQLEFAEPLKQFDPELRRALSSVYRFKIELDDPTVREWSRQRIRAYLGFPVSSIKYLDEGHYRAVVELDLSLENLLFVSRREFIQNISFVSSRKRDKTQRPKPRTSASFTLASANYTKLHSTVRDRLKNSLKVVGAFPLEWEQELFNADVVVSSRRGGVLQAQWSRATLSDHLGIEIPKNQFHGTYDTAYITTNLSWKSLLRISKQPGVTRLRHIPIMGDIESEIKGTPAYDEDDPRHEVQSVSIVQDVYGNYFVVIKPEADATPNATRTYFIEFKRNFSVMDLTNHNTIEWINENNFYAQFSGVLISPRETDNLRQDTGFTGVAELDSNGKGNFRFSGQPVYLNSSNAYQSFDFVADFRVRNRAQIPGILPRDLDFISNISPQNALCRHILAGGT